MKGFATFICIGMFLLPIAGIAFNCYEVNKAEKEWKEACRIENEKTERSIEAFNKAVQRAKVNEN